MNAEEAIEVTRTNARRVANTARRCRVNRSYHEHLAWANMTPNQLNTNASTNVEHTYVDTRRWSWMTLLRRHGSTY